jgi:radical SAM superfamily enzyme YgiQ (UPF0313 family)
MNVLLIITNINGEHEVSYSFGLSSIAGYIEKKGHNCKIMSVTDKKGYHNLIDEIRQFQPEVIGFTSVSSQFVYVKELAELIKGYKKEIIVVCGGVHPTLYPDALLESNYVDGFFVGESEVAFGEFLEKLEQKAGYFDVPNYAYRKNNKVIIKELHALIRNLDELPYPKKGHLFKEAIDKTRLAPFLFSRGCPFACSYCSNHSLARIYGLKHNNPRYRSVESAINEIKNALKEYNFQIVYIYDDIFGLNKKWAISFCEKFKREINKKFLCQLRVNVVDESFIRALKDAGCYRIQFGVESGNEYIRNTVMNRNLSNEQIKNAFLLCRKYKIETNSLNIIGVPGETEEMIWDTIKLNREIKPTSSGISIFYPYQGTKLGDYCFDNGLVDHDAYGSFSNERRESVLNYPDEYKEKLTYYYKNWTKLVYPSDIKKSVKTYISKYPTIYGVLKKIKRSIT